MERINSHQLQTAGYERTTGIYRLPAACAEDDVGFDLMVMAMNGWILFAHGSSDPDWARPMRSVADRVGKKLGPEAVALAFLERQQPSLEDAAAGLIRSGFSTITVIPMFLGIGGHLKNDLPLLIDAMRARWVGIEFRLTAPIGESEAVADAIAGFVMGAAGGQDDQVVTQRSQ